MEEENLKEEDYNRLKGIYKKCYEEYLTSKEVPNYITENIRRCVDIWNNICVEDFDLNEIKPFEIYSE